jgi:hypothetical protein
MCPVKRFVAGVVVALFSAAMAACGSGADDHPTTRVPVRSAGYEPYAWLNIDVNDPDWIFTEGLLFTFVLGLSPAEVAERLDLPVQHLDLTNQQDPLRYFVIDGKAVLDAGGGWTVLYEDNSIPEDSSHVLAHDPAADKVVSVFTNVNSVMEFAYWQRGDLVVRFEFPDERGGHRPDALLDEMRATTGVHIDDYERAMSDGSYLARMMTLAHRVTSVHLGPDFLRRPLLGVPPEN